MTKTAMAFVLSCLFLFGCVAGQQFMDELKKELRENDWKQDLRQSMSSGDEPVLDAEGDSLFALIAQDVGINPKEGNVQRLIWRVRVIRFNAESASQAIRNGRTEIFNIAANAEELKTLKEMDQQIESASPEEQQELIAEKRRYQDTTIKNARKRGELEKKKLKGDQAKRFGLLLYNLGVAAITDGLALRHIPKIDNDFKEVKKDLTSRGGFDALWAGLSLGIYHEEFIAIPAELVGFTREIPVQLGAIGNLIGTIGVLKKNNQIEEREIETGDGFVTDEDF